MKDYNDFLEIMESLFTKLQIDVEVERKKCRDFKNENEYVFNRFQQDLESLEYCEDDEDKLYDDVTDNLISFQEKTNHISNEDGILLIINIMKKYDEADIEKFTTNETVMQMIDGAAFNISKSSVGYIYKTYLLDEHVNSEFDGGFCSTYKSAWYSSIISNLHMNFCFSNITRIFLENAEVQKLKDEMKEVTKNSLN